MGGGTGGVLGIVYVAGGVEAVLNAFVLQAEGFGELVASHFWTGRQDDRCYGRG